MNTFFAEFEEINKENKENKKTIKKSTKNTFEIYGTLENKLFVSCCKEFVNNTVALKCFDIFEANIKYNSKEQSMVKIYGKSIPIPRKQVAYGEPGTYYNFSGIKVDAFDWNIDNVVCKLLLYFKFKLQKIFGVIFNFVLINRYANGDDYVGFHSDDENDLCKKSPIANLTFGATRDFILKHKQTNEKLTLQLNNGSCVCMHYPTNCYWQHSIPKRANVDRPRISLTFRCMN